MKSGMEQSVVWNKGWHGTKGGMEGRVVWKEEWYGMKSGINEQQLQEVQPQQLIYKANAFERDTKIHAFNQY
jgi:hypothetical protein